MNIATTPPITSPQLVHGFCGSAVRPPRIVRLPDTPRRAIAAPTPAAPVAQRPASRAPAAPPAPTRAQLEATRVEASVASAEAILREGRAKQAAEERRILAEGRARQAAEERHVASILAMHRGVAPAPAIPAADAQRASAILALVPRRRGARHG